MTKYILHGGATSKNPGDSKKFFLEIAKDVEKDPINALCIYFARDKELWNDLFEQDKNNFLNASPKKNFNFVLADDDLENFKNQIEKANVIYFRGGRNKMIFDVLSRIKNLKFLFKDKVVSGNSAGVNVLSTYYYSDSKAQIKDGLGILPVKTFPHYTEGKKEIVEKLENYRENLKLYKIPEGKFFVLNEE